ncbi:MAG: hypothetical protein WCT36_04390 [Candidatus Gracilibacteria bacterium]|jgi:hypothetical protein
MTLLQVKIDNDLSKAIKDKAVLYGVPASSLVKIVLVRSFLTKEDSIDEGNIFNANRDNKGKGINIDDLISAL